MWQVSVCAFVTFLFQLMLKQKSLSCRAPPFHSCSDLKSLYLTSEGYSFLTFYLLKWAIYYPFFGLTSLIHVLTS